MNTIENKVVVIIGASSGIGAATTRRLANAGAKLVIAARREEKLKELSAELKDKDVLYKVADVTKKEDIQAVVDFAVATYGRIDVIYNNAGIMPQGNLSERDYDTWKQMLDVNIMGVLYGIGAAIPYMKEQKSG